MIDSLQWCMYIYTNKVCVSASKLQSYVVKYILFLIVYRFLSLCVSIDGCMHLPPAP